MPLEPRTNRVVFVAVAVGADVRVDHQLLRDGADEVVGARREELPLSGRFDACSSSVHFSEQHAQRLYIQTIELFAFVVS